MNKRFYLGIISGLFLLLIVENAFSQNVGVNNTNPLSTLDVTGSFGNNIRSVTSSATLTSTDATILASPGVTITLPSSVGTTRRQLLIVYNGASGGTSVIIKPVGTDHIISNNISYAAASGITLNTGSIDIQSDGSGNWYCTINTGAQSGNSWLLTGNSGTTSSNYLGSSDNIGLSLRTNATERIHIDSLGRVGIGSDQIGAFDPSNPEKLLVDYGNTTSGTAANFTGNIAGFLQINVQNKNSGTNSSSDVVATADNGTDSTEYADFGINSSTYAPSVDNFGGPNDAYLYCYARNLIFGTEASTADMIFLINGGSIKNNTAFRIVNTTRNLVVGKGEATNFAVGNTIRGPNGSTAITNTPGGSLTLQGGSSSGTATGANLNLNGGASASGLPGSVNINASANFPTNIGTGTTTQNVTIGGSSNGILFPAFTTIGGMFYTSAVTGQISGTTQMIWDNTNTRLGIGITVPTTTLQVNGTATLGKASATTGALSFLNSTNANTLGLQSGVTSASYSMVLPTAIGAANQALTISSISGTTATLGWTTPVTAGTAWLITGNSSTVDGTNFLGTTDNIPLTLRVNNVMAGRIDNTLANSLFGYQAGLSAAGTGNTGTGYQALFSIATGGNYNTASGYKSIYSNTTGDDNVASGYESLYSNVTGVDNTAIGNSALQSSTSTGMTAVGAYALQLYTTTGTDNSTAIGYKALSSDVTGSFNTAVGYQALKTTTVGGNTAVGTSALQSTTTGTSNTAEGRNSLLANTTGTRNTAVGSSSLTNNLVGNDNTAIGESSLNNSTGNSNTAVGGNSLTANTTASNNTALGYAGLQKNTTGAFNTALGSNTLQNNLTGSSNVAIGNIAGQNITSSNNVVVGSNASTVNVTGGNNTLIGYKSDVVTDGITNATAIGYLSAVNQSNSLVLGSINGVNGSVSNTNVGIGITAPTTMLQVNGTASLGSASSVTGLLSFLNSSNANTLGIQSGVTSASYSMVLPTAIGTAAQVLTISSIAGTTATLGWTTPAAAGGSNWSLTGNSGTTAGTNFLGTTDGQALEFKVNSAVAGYLGLSGSSYATSLGVGASGASTAFEGTAIGAGAQATGANASVAIGYNSLANTQDDIAMGDNAQAKSSNEAIAIGHSAVASSYEGIAIGATASATTSNQTVALGYGATASGYQATAIGNGASATAQNSTAIGNGATTSQTNTVILGSGGAQVGIGTSTPSTALQVNGTATLGSASSTTGTLSLLNSSNANTFGIQPGVTSASYTMVMPTAIGAAGQDLTVSSVAGTTATMGWGSQPTILVAATRTSAYTPAVAYATLDYNSTSVNVGAAYNTGTGIFTAPATGTYQIIVSNQFSTTNAANNSVYARIVVNAATDMEAPLSEMPYAGTVYGAINMTDIVTMTSGQTASITIGGLQGTMTPVIGTGEQVLKIVRLN